MSCPQQYFYASAQDMAEKLSGSIAQGLQQNLQQNGHAMLILPGGSSPKTLIQNLARQDIVWPDIQITTTDERKVPLDDPASNAGQVERLFAAEGKDVKPVHLLNDNQVQALMFPATVTVLGMGLDGHFASLFPGDADYDAPGIICDATAPAEPKNRVSLTFQTLLQSQRLILLLPDAEKWAVCRKALAGDAPDLPVAELIEAAKEKLTLHIGLPEG